MKELLDRILVEVIVETYFQKILEGVSISEVFEDGYFECD